MPYYALLVIFLEQTARHLIVGNDRHMKMYRLSYGLITRVLIHLPYSQKIWRIGLNQREQYWWILIWWIAEFDLAAPQIWHLHVHY